MNIIEQATKRLEELQRAGVAVPWAAAGVAEGDLRKQASKATWPAPARRAEAQRARRNSAHVKLDLDRLAQSGVLVPDQKRSLLADEFRVIKRPLLKNARGEGAAPVARGNLIMITSALPGEGKSFCAINLAMSLAMEMETSVLLVDADVVRPALLNRLGLPAAKGLLDVLTDRELDLSEVLLRTNVPKLSLLPAGTPSPKSTELLASAAMEQLLIDVATMYPDRVVIFDAPPLLVTTEAGVLASRMGQVVLVVEASRTLHGEVSQAMAAIEQCPVVMSVLNKSRVSVGPSGYGYY